MNIKITIYDIFANTIPGAINILVVTYLLHVFKLIELDFWTLDFSLSQIFFFILFAYVSGLILDIMAFKFWYQIFSKNKKDIMYEISYKAQKERFKNFEFQFQADDWPILLAKIEHTCSNWALETNKFNALYILMRNLSFSLFILFVAGVFDLIFNNISIIVILMTVSSFLFSILSLNRATQFERYFYNMIIEGSLGLNLKLPLPKETESTES